MRNLDTDAEIARFNQSVEDFTTLMNVVLTLSNDTHGREVQTWRKEYGSHIFTKLVFHSIALRKIFPDLSPQNPIVLWDICSIAVLARALMETYYAFFYVSVEEISDEESEFRYIVWEHHSVANRVIKLDKIKSKAPQVDEYRKQEQLLKNKITNHNLFSSLPKETGKRILKGDIAILLSNSALSKRAGIDSDHYKAQFNSLSSYVHTYPFCVSQMAAFNGVNADTINLAYAVRDFVKVFPDQVIHISQEVDSIIEIWTHVFENIGCYRSGQYNEGTET